MSAHDWIKNARRAIAHWLYEPFATTAWEPSRTTTALLPAPAQQTTGAYAYTLPSIIDGIVGAPTWHGPSHTWTAVYLHQEPHRRRDTDILVPPVQNSGPMHRLHPARLTPIPETSEPARDEFGFSELNTWHTPETHDRQVSDAIARIDRVRYSWLYDELPADASSTTDRTASGVIEANGDAMYEVEQFAQQQSSGLPKMPDPDVRQRQMVEINKQNVWSELTTLANQKTAKETVEVPAYMRKRAQQMQKAVKGK